MWSVLIVKPALVAALLAVARSELLPISCRPNTSAVPASRLNALGDPALGVAVQHVPGRDADRGARGSIDAGAGGVIARGLGLPQVGLVATRVVDRPRLPGAPSVALVPVSGVPDLIGHPGVVLWIAPRPGVQQPVVHRVDLPQAVVAARGLVHRSRVPGGLCTRDRGRHGDLIAGEVLRGRSRGGRLPVALGGGEDARGHALVAWGGDCRGGAENVGQTDERQGQDECCGGGGGGRQPAATTGLRGGAAVSRPARITVAHRRRPVVAHVAFPLDAMPPHRSPTITRVLESRSPGKRIGDRPHVRGGVAQNRSARDESEDTEQVPFVGAVLPPYGARPSPSSRAIISQRPRRRRDASRR